MTLLLLVVVGLFVALTAHILKRVVCRPQQDMNGKVVLLTGAGGGFGRQLALQLARRGCLLALVDVFEEANEETASQARDAAASAGRANVLVRTYTADLGSREAVQGLVRDVTRDFGRVDVLLSNAAILHGGGVCSYTDDEVDRMLLVNLRATILLVRGLLPGMRARRAGHVVTVSSAAGVMPNHDMTLYGASKAGLTHFMECLYRELRMDGLEKDIATTTIHPYFMKTFDLIFDASEVQGWLAWLAPFLDPAWAAQKAVESIARREHYIFIPYHLKYGTLIVSIFPRCLQNPIMEKVLRLKFKRIPPYEYRHRKRDVHMLHDFLREGLVLFCDPAPLLQAMCDDCRASGQSPPYDFTPFRRRLEAYYEEKGEHVPAIVQKYIY